MNDRSVRRGGRYWHNTQQKQETYIHALSRIRTHDPSTRAATDLRLKPHGHQDWFFFYIYMWQNRSICVNTRTLQFSISVDADHTAHFDRLSVNILYLTRLFVVTVSALKKTMDFSAAFWSVLRDNICTALTHSATVSKAWLFTEISDISRDFSLHTPGWFCAPPRLLPAAISPEIKAAEASNWSFVSA